MAVSWATPECDPDTCTTAKHSKRPRAPSLYRCQIRFTSGLLKFLLDRARYRSSTVARLLLRLRLGSQRGTLNGAGLSRSYPARLRTKIANCPPTPSPLGPLSRRPLNDLRTGLRGYQKAHVLYTEAGQSPGTHRHVEYCIWRQHRRQRLGLGVSDNAFDERIEWTTPVASLADG